MESGAEGLNASQNRIVASLSLMMILSTAVFFLRLLARRISVARYWYDDYMVFIALVCLSPNTFTVIQDAVESSPF